MSLPTRTLLAILEEAGYRREEMRRLTRRYVMDVLNHDRDTKGRLRTPDAPRKGPAATLAQILRGRKMPEWLIAQKVREERAADAQQAVPKKPPPKGPKRKR